jgi:hypothetical protein
LNYIQGGTTTATATAAAADGDDGDDGDDHSYCKLNSTWLGWIWGWCSEIAKITPRSGKFGTFLTSKT